MDNENSLHRNSTIKQQRILCVARWLQRYADTFHMYGKTLADFPERQEAFLQVLATLSVDAIDAGFAACLNTCTEFPVPFEVETEARRWQQDHVPTTRRYNSVAEIDPENCPKGWTPEEVFRAHLTQERIRGGARAPMRRDESSDFPTFDELGQRLKIPREQIQEWLEAGKEAQQEHYAKLEADPQWRAMAERLGAIPGLTPKAVPTTVPDDPDERAP